DGEPEADRERRATEVSHDLGRGLGGFVLRRALRQDVAPDELPVRKAAADDDVATDREEGRRVVAVIDDRHDAALPLDVLQAEAKATGRVRVAAQRPDNRPDRRHLADVPGELA